MGGGGVQTHMGGVHCTGPGGQCGAACGEAGIGACGPGACGHARASTCARHAMVVSMQGGMHTQQVAQAVCRRRQRAARAQSVLSSTAALLAAAVCALGM
jgi:hypothetical protein